MEKVSLFRDILSTKGYVRSLLLDTTRFNFYYISNELLTLFEEHNYKSINSQSIESGFFNMLLTNELIYESDEKNEDCFTEMEVEWDFPFKISNLTIELSNENIDDLSKFQNFHFVAHIHILINCEISISTIEKLFKFLEIQHCDCVEFSIVYKLENEVYHRFIELSDELIKIIKFLNYAEINLEQQLEKPHRFNIDLSSLSQKISKFSYHFFESLEHHTYFNRKLFISNDGLLKCTIDSKESYGNIQNIQTLQSIIDIIDSNEFQKYWFVKKSQTDFCKDCEFKNICLDTRIPIQRNQNEWFHLNNCDYNPYIAKWNDEEGYLSPEECGIISNKDGFYIDHKKLDEINTKLWDDEEVTE